MTLTVRLDSALESALEQHCEQLGLSKSQVVQQSLATYLWAHAAAGTGSAKAADSGAPSDNYRSFDRAGLLGVVSLGTGADKAAVRARAVEALRRRGR